jgi:FkbM family methyltransferase
MVDRLMNKLVKSAYRMMPWKAEIFNVLRRLPIPESLFKHLHFTGPFTARVNSSHSFRINHYGDIANNELFWRGLSAYEPTTIELWTRLARKSSIIVDGGAHLGLYSLVAATVNPAATVLAFEPEPRVHARLKENLALNSFRIRAEKLALSDTTGSATFYVAGNIVGSSLNSYFFDVNLPGTSTVSVEAVRLDDYLARHGMAGADLIKLDVERHEPAALRGLGDILQRSQPAVITEILDEDVGEQVMAAVAHVDYRMFIIEEGEGIFPVSVLKPPPGKVGQNFLLCSKMTARDLGLNPEHGP